MIYEYIATCFVWDGRMIPVACSYSSIHHVVAFTPCILLVRYLFCSGVVPRGVHFATLSSAGLFILILIVYVYFEKKYERVSCEIDKFRVDTHLCKLRDTPNFVTIMKELNKHTVCMKYVEVSVVSISFTFSFEISRLPLLL